MRKIWLWWCKISQTHTWCTCKHLSLKISAVRYFFCQSVSPQLPSVICCLSRRKKGGGTVPENGNACLCCCLRLAVGAFLGLDRYLHMPPSLPRWQQKQDEKQDGEALISFFFLPQASAAAFEFHLPDARGCLACCSDLALHSIYPAQTKRMLFSCCLLTRLVLKKNL